ncbi:hypothetical protein ACQ86E_03590 [Bradyrhizobium betae]|uniref:hypothetical protein n=1 Tax=Bradyrhizobium betae TaxID=244734 RepID=UPI003D6744FF
MKPVTHYTFGPKQLAALMYACSAICCASLICVAALYPEFHITFHPGWLFSAVLATLSFAGLSWLFAYARFSFGYLIGLYFYAMILGYLWLSTFSQLSYNHALSGLSAAVSAASFLLPALLITTPLRQICPLSIRSVDRLLIAILVAAIATVAAGAKYNFKLVALEDIYQFRGELAFPTILNYAIGIVSSALLPFAYACFALRSHFWRAGLVVLLMLLFYPVTLSKMSLFAPAWLVGLTVASRIIDSRATVVLSVLVPVSLGLILYALHNSGVLASGMSMAYFGLVNFRMTAIPSLAMEYYNYFFATHELTHFCQIRLLSPLVDCPYNEPLAVIIYKYFGIGGYFNASLFATEGIASVGAVFAPLTALACGLVIATANRMSTGLPDRFIMLSGGVLAQAFLNVPFTTTLLSHGAGFTFLLWYLMPREMFEPGPGKQHT